MLEALHQISQTAHIDRSRRRRTSRSSHQICVAEGSRSENCSKTIARTCDLVVSTLARLVQFGKPVHWPRDEHGSARKSVVQCLDRSTAAFCRNVPRYTLYASDKILQFTMLRAYFDVCRQLDLSLHWMKSSGNHCQNPCFFHIAISKTQRPAQHNGDAHLFPEISTVMVETKFENMWSSSGGKVSKGYHDSLG